MHACIHARMGVDGLGGGGNSGFANDFFMSALVSRCRGAMVQYQSGQLASVNTPRVDAGRVFMALEDTTGVVTKDQMLRP